MAPTERPWLRLYTETTRDRKLRREKPETRWLWITLLCMAGSSPTRGSLFIGESPATVDDIADEAAMPVSKVKLGIAHFEAAGMIERNGSGAWHLRNWADRQFESDVSTDRVRAFRERQRNVPRNGSVTPPDTETESDHHLSSEPPCGKPDDDDDRSAEDPNRIDPVEVTVRAVFERVADARTEGIAPNAPGPYRARVIANLETEWGEKLRRIVRSHPDAPVETLADWILGNPTSLERYRIEVPS